MSDPAADPGAPESFRTVDGPGEAAFEVRGSEFIGHVAPAADVADAESLLESVRSRHPDATHHVPAYRVPADEAGGGGSNGVTGSDTPDGPAGGAPMLREYHSDDGEPTGSAGKPALNVLLQRDLRNVASVVVRYYGGTNLGVGGLARAYARAVTDAVDDAGVVEAVPHERFQVTVEYDDSGTVRGLLESAGVEFEAAYEAEVSFAVRAPVGEAAALRDRIRSATSGRATIER
ncbi:YigZ family protein [Halobellus ruber]|uniref:YigZ family protein n=1 Tax=Halobellus ruber TaxID=2761102 RepID=A0A7J9SMB8_9EURY|nr:YigZ family protein [Halobellus ruber]